VIRDSSRGSRDISIVTGMPLRRPVAAALSAGILMLVAACTTSTTVTSSPIATTPPVDSGYPADAVVLDPDASYGNRYADGVVPVGDEKWTLTDPAVGTVYLCRDTFVADAQAGARSRGPWFVNGNTEYDIDLKVAIQGSVTWTPRLSVTLEGTAISRSRTTTRPASTTPTPTRSASRISNTGSPLSRSTESRSAWAARSA
jgi:hypothetical protein